MRLPSLHALLSRRSWLRVAVLGLGLCVSSVACASEAPARLEAPGPLYFALEVKHDGKVVAAPKLLGAPGKWVRAEKRQPGATVSDYQLSLLPKQVGDGYRIDLDVSLPREKTQGRIGDVGLEHGEERTLELGSKPGELEVSMLVMRVNSPEFEALMRLSDGEEAKQPETI